MRNLFRVALFATVAGLSGMAAAQSPNAEAAGGLAKINNQYICTFDASVSRANVRAESDRAGGALGQVLHVYRNSIRGFAVRLPAQPGRNPIADLRANNPKVASCEQDQEVKALYQGKGKPGGGGSTGQKIDWGVARVGGPGTPVSGRTAWVIDTGIDLDHPDLNVDTARSRSFISTSSPDDANGHGTHVAGTIAARNNTIGVVGVAAGAPVVAVRVLDRNGRGTNSGVIAGVDYVADVAGAGDVANMSLGGGASTALDDAVKCAADGPQSGVSGCTSNGGIKFVIAAGNSGADANNYSPARANGNNIYTVSAFSNGDNWASFSNFGNPPIDYGEPGVSILSTYKNGGYTTLSGTSMAAPHLAGILMAGNSIGNGGTVNGDPDGNLDRIGVR